MQRIGYSILRAQAFEEASRYLARYIIITRTSIVYVHSAQAPQRSGLAQASELRLHRSDLSHRCRAPLQGRASVEASSPCHASASAEAHLVRGLLRTGIRLEVRIVG